MLIFFEADYLTKRKIKVESVLVIFNCHKQHKSENNTFFLNCSSVVLLTTSKGGVTVTYYNLREALRKK